MKEFFDGELTRQPVESRRFISLGVIASRRGIACSWPVRRDVQACLYICLRPWNVEIYSTARFCILSTSFDLTARPRITPYCSSECIGAK